MTRKLDGSLIQSSTITLTQLSSSVANSISSGGGPKVKSLIYPGNDTAANTIGGQTIYITGSGFAANALVYINGSAVPSQSFISASNISFTTPNLASTTYPVYVINPEDGGTAILVPGIIISGEPAWVTAAGSLSESQEETSAWSYSLSASGDTPITYALAAGNTLPTGVSLAANGLISGTITSPSGNATTYTFSVVATDAQNQDSTRQFTVTTVTGEGVLFANNVLLIHADGTNNQNNHHFLDSSNNNFTITRNGNATQGSFSPFSQTGWSNYFDGTGDYLTTPSNTAFGFGTGNFTIELWYYHVSRASTDTIFALASDNLSLYINTSGILGYWNGSVNNSSQTVPLNTWNHIAFVRSGSTAKIYYNGVEVFSGSNSINYATTSVIIGNNPSTDYSHGYISNLRVLKGTALYTSTFTPPTAALTAISNTSLLTCQSNRFIDNSTNAFTITRNGDVSVQAFSPFAPTDAYTTANVGGSGYFDGSGDYLSIADSTAFDLNTTFTVECWFYLAATGNMSLFTRGGGAGSWSTSNGHEYLLFIEGSLYWMWNTSGSPTYIGITPPPTNTWNHIAIAYNGTTTRGWLNGTSFGSSSSGYTLPTTRNITRVGLGPSSSYPLNGYISSLRVVKGTAVYDPTQSTITVPTAPPTNIANTSLLCNFTNAGIFDQTAKNVLETVGDAKVSTAQYKYGTASISCSSSGDGLNARDSDLFDMSSGDFTVEMWLRANNLTNEQFLVGQHNYSSYYAPFRLAFDGTKLIGFMSTSGSAWGLRLEAGSALSNNTWYHVALVRYGTSFKLYVNGSQYDSGTLSGALYNSSDIMRIGWAAISISNFTFNGYIDDLRITKGYARYTSNFTPPTSALKDK